MTSITERIVHKQSAFCDWLEAAAAEALTDRTWRDEIDVITTPSLKPQNIIGDYVAVEKVLHRQCIETSRSRKGQGNSIKAVTHAIAEHDIKLSRVTRKKGDFLCGSRWGYDCVTSLQSVNCPQCAKAIASLELNPSIRIKDGFWSCQ